MRSDFDLVEWCLDFIRVSPPLNPNRYPDLTLIGPPSSTHGPPLLIVSDIYIVL